MMITLPKIKGDYTAELLYNPYYFEVLVSRAYKNVKEVYKFIHQAPHNHFSLFSYEVYEYNKKGQYEGLFWWSRNAGTNSRNNLTLSDIPMPKELKRIVLDKFIDGIKFKPFENAVDGPQPLPPPSKKKKDRKEKEPKSKVKKRK